MARRSSSKESKLPRRGYALVTVAVCDENGFTHQYERIEAPIGAVRDAMALLHLQSTALDAAAADARTA